MRRLGGSERLLDVSSFAGIMGGMAVFLPACLVPEMRFLALPAFVVLLPSLMLGLR
jgi:hypothetical protein